MRIGIAAIGRVSEDTGGKNYIIHFLREIERAKTKHEFVLFLSEGEAGRLGISTSERVTVVTVPNSKNTPLHKVIGEQWKLPAYIRQERIDLMYYPGNFVSLLSRVPSVVNIRSAAHFYGAEYGISGIRRLVRAWLMPASARKADAIITPSNDIKRDVVRFTRASATKIEVIPHGVDLSLFDGDRNRGTVESTEVLDRCGLTSGAYLLFVSALWRYKNQDKLIHAHAEVVRQGFPELKLVLAGKGTGTDPKYIREITELPKSVGTESLVVMTGGLDQRTLASLYANAAAFVFPSSYESFGNPIFEAWASSVPVATANVHSFPEIVADAALLFDPLDRQGMVEAILKLLNDKELAAELKRRGSSRAKDFSWELAVSRTLRLLERVYEKHSEHP